MAQGTQGSSDDGLLAYSSLLRSFKKISELIGSCSKCSRLPRRLSLAESNDRTDGHISQDQSPTTCFSTNGTRRIATPSLQSSNLRAAAHSQLFNSEKEKLSRAIKCRLMTTPITWMKRAHRSWRLCQRGLGHRRVQRDR